MYNKDEAVQSVAPALCALPFLPPHELIEAYVIYQSEEKPIFAKYLHLKKVFDYVWNLWIMGPNPKEM